MRFWRRHHEVQHLDDDDDVSHAEGLDPFAEIHIATIVVNDRVGNDMNRTRTFALKQLSQHPRTTVTPTIAISTELLYHSWATLFPAERMAIVGGRRIGRSIVLGPAFDVTSNGPETTRVHVRADPNRLRAALLALERAGAHLAGWIHSHPGLGPEATQPSRVDHAQHRDWVHDYSPSLIGLIIVTDGVVRFWGTALEADAIRIEFVGTGISPVEGYPHAYQLAR